MSAVHVFFFRGLSTYALDDVKWSLFNFGPVCKRLQGAFCQRDIHFYPVVGMGSGSLPEVTERAWRFLQNHPVWRAADVPVHFLGHSAGGLVARLLSERPQVSSHKLLSVLTVATPNLGAELASVCLTMPTNHLVSTGLLRALGYDILAKREFFAGLTRASVQELLPRATRVQGSLRRASLVCASPRREFCIPLKLAYQLKPLRQLESVSDGIVERDSQPFGEVIGELNIDHFRQIGLFGEPERFERLCDVAVNFFKSTQGPAPYR